MNIPITRKVEMKWIFSIMYDYVYFQHSTHHDLEINDKPITRNIVHQIFLLHPTIPEHSTMISDFTDKYQGIVNNVSQQTCETQQMSNDAITTLLAKSQ